MVVENKHPIYWIRYAVTGSSGGMFLAVQSCRSTNPSPSNTVKQADKQQKTTKETQAKTDKTPASRDTSAERGDPSPLICQRKLGVGESPPKIFKKKAPAPTQDGQVEKTRSTAEELREFGKTNDQQKPIPKHTCVDKENHLDPKAVCQVSFTQERHPSKSEIARKPGQDANKVSREGPKPQDAIPRPHPREPLKQSSTEDVSKRPPGHSSGQPLTTPSAPGRPGSSSQPLPNSSTSRQTLGQSHSSPNTNQSTSTVPPSSGSKVPISQKIPKLELSLATNSSNEGMCNSLSTEKLISDQSPESLRPVNRIEDVNTIKRPPKAGWL